MRSLVLYSHRFMPAPARHWTRTYIWVIVIEVLVLMSLWWLQRHYGM